MPGRSSPPSASNINRILFRYRLALVFLSILLFIQLLIKLIRRLKAPPHGGAGSAIEQASILGEPFEGVEFSFEVAAPAAEAAPDVYTPLPPDLLLESSELILTADGKLLRYQFNWQNPVLREGIYPFRKEKLLDFLLYFLEIDDCWPAWLPLPRNKSRPSSDRSNA